MDTATNDVPTFKLAKVGQERKRRRGAGAFWGGGQGAGGLAGLGGGAEAGGGLFAELSALSVGKVLTVLLVSGLLGAGAWQFGKMFSGGDNAAPKGQKLFADKGSGKYSDTSDVVKADNSIPNSLGYVSGSLDGMTPEERARKAAADEAARKAAEDAAKKQAEEDAKKAAAAPTDATAAGAATGGDAAAGGNGFGFGRSGSAFSSRFGALSGGSGMSGGIGGHFSGGGLGNGNNGTKGTLSGMSGQAKPSMAKAAAHALSPATSKNLAMAQLQRTNAASRSAAAQTGTGASTAASAPFDGGISGGGTSIAGPGDGSGSTGGSGVTSGGSNPSGGPVGGGGGGSCSAGQGMDASGNCVNLNSGGSANAASYQYLINIAEMLMALMAILAAIAMIADKAGPFAFIGKYIEAIMVVMGLMIAACGAGIIAMSHDIMIGGIVTVVGLATAGWALFAPQNALSSTKAINLAAGALIANAVGMLAASAASANSASM